MRTLTHSCGLPFPLFPLFPLRKHPERLRGVFFASRCGAAGRAGAGLVEGLPSWCWGRWPDSPCRLHGRPVPALPASAGVRKVTAPALRCARNCRVPLPTIIQSYR